MANATPSLISLLRETANHLDASDEYQWGHMGMCNCGFLARTVTGLSEHVIHEAALQRGGDWEQQANDYCPTSGLMIDSIIATMIAIGLTPEDIAHLEKLSDNEVLQRLPAERRYLSRNVKRDVVLYLREWAEMLEERVQRDMLVERAESSRQAAGARAATG